MKKGGLILAIETSCDETGVAVVEDGRAIRANVVASQVAMHAAAGGIVPEVAARAHLRWIVPVFDEAWYAAGAGWDDIAAVAVTHGPGLAGSLLVGVNFAKTLAYVHRKPLVPVNHLEGHLYAAWLAGGESQAAEPLFPAVALIVSGGHTFLVEMPGHLSYRLLGETVDDAAGEAFDKVGRLLGLPYPGGPAVMEAAAGAVRRDVVFPRAWMGDSFDFSFSGLKTAARRMIAAERDTAAAAASGAGGETGGAGGAVPGGVVPGGVAPGAGGEGGAEMPLPQDRVAELAYGFQDSVVDVLVTKTLQAARQVGAASVILGGGVAANRALRERLGHQAGRAGIPLVVPRPALCTDNAAMIGAAAARRYEAGTTAGLDLDARPSLPLARR